MNEQIVKQIAKDYGLLCKTILPIEKGYRNENHPLVTSGGQTVNIIIYKNEPLILLTIKNANRTSNYLAERGFPVRRTLDSRIICLQAGNWQKYACLYNYLPGHTIPWEAYTMQHIKLLGSMLSNMHAELKNLPYLAYPSVIDQYQMHMNKIRYYINDNGVKLSLRHKLSIEIDNQAIDWIQRLLKACQKLTQQQVLHLDFVRSNILFDSTRRTDASTDLIISGVLDFEKTAYGHPLFDIARSLAFLLVDCKYKTEQQIRKYFLFSGYQKRGTNRLPQVKIKDANKSVNLLDSLVDMFLLYDLYKFLNHNPYEFLSANEHYIRTRDKLLIKGLIRTIDATIKQSK